MREQGSLSRAYKQLPGIDLQVGVRIRELAALLNGSENTPEVFQCDATS